METQLTRFNEVDGAIAKLSAEFMPLKIAGPDDATGYKRVHSARMDVKSKRVEVEKARKQYKEDALAWGRKVDSEAKRITALLEPIETHLQSEEDAYNAAKEAIKNAARLKAEAEEKARREAEEARLKAEREAEAAQLAEERCKLDEERRAMEEERARQRAEQDRIEAERRKIEEEARKIADAKAAEERRLAAIEAEKVRQAELEKARQEAAERARIETEKRLARESAEREAAEKAKREAAEAARIKAEAMRPDREKLLAVAAAVLMIKVPPVCHDANKAADAIIAVLERTEKEIRAIVEKMLPAPDDLESLL